MDPSNQTLTPPNTKRQLLTRRNVIISVLIALAIAIVAWSIIMLRAASSPVPYAPTNLRAFTGGKDVAVLWNVSQSSAAIKQYNVYRDYRVVARIAPTNDSTQLTAKGTRYYDANVKPGVKYVYQVSTTDINGTTSGLSQPLSVTHPTQSSAVPTITLDAGGTTDLTTPLNNAKAMLETWYPKIANRLAWPDYTPPTSFTIKVDPNYAGLAQYEVGTKTIRISAKHLRENPKDLGTFIHEATHTVQGYTTYVPSFIHEGLADWIRESMYNDRNPVAPPASATYNEGYSPSAYFLKWIDSTYNKQVTRQLNISAHKDGSYAPVLTSATGKTVAQLWKQMTGRTVSNLGPVTGVAGRCLDLLNYDTTNGNTIQLMDCRKNSAQDWLRASVSSTAGAYTLRVRGKCMDVKYSGKTASTPVWIWSCNEGAAQQWIPQSNGTLKNPNSGMCLQTKGSATTNGTPLEIAVCNGSAAQKWGLPPL